MAATDTRDHAGGGWVRGADVDGGEAVMMVGGTQLHKPLRTAGGGGGAVPTFTSWSTWGSCRKL